MIRFWVKNGGQQFYAVDEARAWSAEIGRGIHDVAVRPTFNGLFPCLLHRPCLSQFLKCPFNRVSAGHHQNDIRLSGFHLVPRRFAGGSLWRPEHIAASGNLHHFRNPVAGDVERSQPFETDDAWAGRLLLGTCADTLDAMAECLG